jgi:hypothetical protein
MHVFNVQLITTLRQNVACISTSLNNSTVTSMPHMHRDFTATAIHCLPRQSHSIGGTTPPRISTSQRRPHITQRHSLPSSPNVLPIDHAPPIPRSPDAHPYLSALNHPAPLISTHSTSTLTTKPQHLGTLHTTTCTTRPSPPDPACHIASPVIFNDWLPFFVRGSGAGRRVSVVGEVGRCKWTLTWWICDGWVRYVQVVRRPTGRTVFFVTGEWG